MALIQMFPGKKTLILMLLAGLTAFAVGFAVRELVGAAEGPEGQRPAPVKIARGIAIGGDFNLTDHTGRPVTLKDFRGEFLLVFFGYTFCPDVCPTELQRMSEVLRKLGAAADRVRPLFITIDPARDTVKVLAEYVGNFHPRLVGLTGTEAQIKAAAKGYGVYFGKTWATETGKPPPGMDPARAQKEYFMSHTALVYLLGTEGELRDIFRSDVKDENMMRRILAVLEN